MRPDGIVAKRSVATTEMKNCTIPRMRASELVVPLELFSAIAM
jgi:hypothetical protein